MGLPQSNRCRLVAAVALALAALPSAAPAQVGPPVEVPPTESEQPIPLVPPDAPPPPASGSGQEERDIRDLLGRRPAKTPSVPRPGQLMMFLLPAFGASPTVGVAVGVAGSAAIALGPPESTLVSSMSASLMVTTRDQLMASLKSVILTSGNTWELLGDYRLYAYAEPTYGLGTGGTPVSGGFGVNGIDTAALPGGQPLTFNYLKVHETAFRRVSGPIYLGLGYHLDRHGDIEDQRLALDATPPAVTSHYAYSRVEGFSPTHYQLSGVSLDALWESRDHTLSPYRGVYLQLGYRVNPTWLGSTRASSSAYGEFRTYVPLGGRPRHLLAIWAFADGVVTGAVPYLDLPAIGYDTRGRSGRGYAAGRFRGTALAYGEVEWRFPLTKSGILGGVAFLNATTAARPRVDVPELGVSDPGIALFQSVKPGGGVGLRLTADRQARMNIVIDYGVGAGGSNGLYLSMGETF